MLRKVVSRMVVLVLLLVTIVAGIPGSTLAYRGALLTEECYTLESMEAEGDWICSCCPCGAEFPWGCYEHLNGTREWTSYVNGSGAPCSLVPNSSCGESMQGCCEGMCFPGPACYEGRDQCAACRARCQEQTPPKPGEDPTKEPGGNRVISKSLVGGKVQLVVHFPSDWDWKEMHGRDFWTVVEWQDPEGHRHEVEGWRGKFDSIEIDGSGVYAGKKEYWVGAKDLGDSDFRWQVYAAEDVAEPLITTEVFALPDNAYRTLVEVKLMPDGDASTVVSYQLIPGFRKDKKQPAVTPEPITAGRCEDNNDCGDWEVCVEGSCKLCGCCSGISLECGASGCNSDSVPVYQSATPTECCGIYCDCGISCQYMSFCDEISTPAPYNTYRCCIGGECSECWCDEPNCPPDECTEDYHCQPYGTKGASGCEYGICKEYDCVCKDAACSNCMYECQTDADCLLPMCGDGRIDDKEECDPFASPDGCGSGETCTKDCVCEPDASCGDGVINGSEECDPAASPDGCGLGETCSNSCTCEKDP